MVGWIKVAGFTAGFAIAMALLAFEQWNVWSWLGAAIWGAGFLGAMEWERQKRNGQ